MKRTAGMATAVRGIPRVAPARGELVLIHPE